MAPAAQSADGPDVVRVRVLAASTVRSAEIDARGGAVALRADGRLVATLPAGRRVTARASGRRVHVSGDGLDALAGQIEFVAEPGALVGIAAGNTRRTYPGTLRARSDGALTLINVAPTEEYVAAVVAGEYPFTELEGVKAQAVLARTYALHRRGRLGDHDVVDSIMDQVYPGAGAATATTRQAAAETAGQVLAYGGSLAEVYYSSSNGGHSAFNDAVWGRAPLPYLRGRPDPFDESPDSRWTARIPTRRVHDALGRRYGGSVSAVQVDSRSPDGRVHWMRLSGSRRDRILGQDFRMMTIEVFGGRVLRSTLFDMRREGADYVFEGRGWGHGVGLSQYGARAQARSGRSYREILDFYFTGALLTAAGGTALLDATTPTDPAERAAMGLRTRPMTRAERAGSTGTSLVDRIEERLRDAEGRILPTSPDSTEGTSRQSDW